MTMKRIWGFCWMFALCVLAFGCSSAEMEPKSLGSTQEALCTGIPAPYGNCTGSHGNYIDTVSGTSSVLAAHETGGSSANVGTGTGAGFSCSGSWTSGAITSVTFGPISGGLGCRFHFANASTSANVDCASTDGSCASGTWSGSYLTSIIGETVAGVPRIRLVGAPKNVTANVVLSNACQ